MNSAISNFPFPHLVIKEALNTNFYSQLLNNLPENSILDSLENARGTKGYKDRFVLNLKKDKPLLSNDRTDYSAINQLTEELLNESFANSLLRKFPEAAKRAQNFQQEGKRLALEAYYVEDHTGYKLPPHTDSKHKLVTGLFYLPESDLLINSGTSLFIPNDLAVDLDSDLHLDRQKFTEVFRVPFASNTALFFARSDNSFHGVEGPFEYKRNLIIFDICAL